VRGLAVSAALIAIAEIFLYVKRYELCIAFHGLNLLFSCIYVILRKDRDVIPLTLPSTFRLVNLAMPVFFTLRTYWLATVYLPMFPAIYYAAKALNMSGEDIGFTAKNIQYLALAVLGIPIGFAEFHLFKAHFSSPLIITALVMLVFVSLVEELVYRGVIQSYFESKYGVYGVGFAVAINAIMASPALKVFTVLPASILGIVYSKTKNIYVSTAIHWVACLTWVLLVYGVH